jgi:hypothetical protein
MDLHYNPGKYEAFRRANLPGGLAGREAVENRIKV